MDGDHSWIEVQFYVGILLNCRSDRSIYVGEGRAGDISCPKVRKSNERLLATSSSLQINTSTSRISLTATAVVLPTANQGGKVPHG